MNNLKLLIAICFVILFSTESLYAQTKKDKSEKSKREKIEKVKESKTVKKGDEFKDTEVLPDMKDFEYEKEKKDTLEKMENSENGKGYGIDKNEMKAKEIEDQTQENANMKSQENKAQSEKKRTRTTIDKYQESPKEKFEIDEAIIKKEKVDKDESEATKKKK